MKKPPPKKKKTKKQQKKKIDPAVSDVARALIAARWSKPDADRKQPALAGLLGGRPKIPTRCKKCGAMCPSAKEARAHKCHGKTTKPGQ